ncbi:hypothetical protein [Bacillus sonorensis]|uniref:hypothetical protein n=1 Tax=Bacillus sonorensis TaxID=119858 RepID=UPI001F504FBE|nr:hypothetical protein [Bacillus sonorensis]
MRIYVVQLIGGRFFGQNERRTGYSNVSNDDGDRQLHRRATGVYTVLRALVMGACGEIPLVQEVGSL